MPEYNVTVTVEKVTRTVTVEAEDAEDAKETALDQLQTGVVAVDREPHATKVVMTPESVEKLHTEIVGRLNKTYTLFYVSQGDELSKAQVQKIAQGDIGIVEEELDEWLWENRHDRAMDAILDVTTEEEREALDDRVDDLRLAVQERDESDPLHELARYTPDASFRYRLAEDMIVYGDEEEAAQTIARILGVPADTEGIQEIVAEGGSSGSLFLYFSMDVEKLLGVMEGIEFRDEKYTLTAEGVDVMILSTMNGSGYVNDTPIEFTFSSDFDPSDLYLDARNAGYGYSWYDTTGGARPSGNGSVKFTKKEEDQ